MKVLCIKQKTYSLSITATEYIKIRYNIGFYSLELAQIPDTSAFVIHPLAPQAEVCDECLWQTEAYLFNHTYLPLEMVLLPHISIAYCERVKSICIHKHHPI